MAGQQKSIIQSIHDNDCGNRNSCFAWKYRISGGARSRNIELPTTCRPAKDLRSSGAARTFTFRAPPRWATFRHHGGQRRHLQLYHISCAYCKSCKCLEYTPSSYATPEYNPSPSSRKEEIRQESDRRRCAKRSSNSSLWCRCDRPECIEQSLIEGIRGCWET